MTHWDTLVLLLGIWFIAGWYRNVANEDRAKRRQALYAECDDRELWAYAVSKRRQIAFCRERGGYEKLSELEIGLIKQPVTDFLAWKAHHGIYKNWDFEYHHEKNE